MSNTILEQQELTIRYLKIKTFSIKFIMSKVFYGIKLHVLENSKSRSRIKQLFLIAFFLFHNLQQALINMTLSYEQIGSLIQYTLQIHITNIFLWYYLYQQSFFSAPSRSQNSVLRLANFHSNKNRLPIRSYSMISPQNGANAAPSRSLSITYTEVKNGQHINMLGRSTQNVNEKQSKH